MDKETEREVELLRIEAECRRDLPQSYIDNKAIAIIALFDEIDTLKEQLADMEKRVTMTPHY